MFNYKHLFKQKRSQLRTNQEYSANQEYAVHVDTTDTCVNSSEHDVYSYNL